MGRPKKNRYKSKKQVAWAFATKQPFAKKWAHRSIRDSGRVTWYRSLPKKVRKKK